MRMSHFALVLVLAATACARWAQPPRFGSLKDENREFDFRHNIELIEVSNGMRVALVHDDRTNVATVDVRYAVGAAEDPTGRAGMAHLVEHLLFELRAQPGGPTLGEELGELALANNASTSWDRTHYTATLPIANLPAVLALEARRMQARCDELDEPTFRRELDIVLAEDKERYSPMSAALFEVLGEVYGAGHPYSRPIGSAEIAAATRAEACAFIAANYTPARAYMVVTGPFDLVTTKGLIGRTFGPIARGPAPPRVPATEARLGGRISRHRAPVDKPTALVFFPYVAWGGEGVVSWEVVQHALAAVLASADAEHAWITNTSVYTLGGERAPVLVAEVEVSSIGMLEQAAEQVFARAASLSSPSRLPSFRGLVDAMTLEYIERWDDLGGRGAWIADFMQYTRHNWFMLKEMRWLSATNWHMAVPAIATQLIQANSHVALLTPGGGAVTRVATAIPAASHDLTPWRAEVDATLADQPEAIEAPPVARVVESYLLPNGLTVQLAPDPDSPLVDARLVFPVGRAHEPADRPHLATAAANMLSYDDEGVYEGPVRRKILRALTHGTVLDTAVTETATTFSARGVAQWGDWHLWLLSWWLDQGRYNPSDLDEMHARARAFARDEDDEVDRVSLAVLGRLFGDGHPYATPAPPLGASYQRIGGVDLTRWRDAHYKARGATLVVSGGFDVAAMKREIDELFGPWSDAAPAALPSIPPIEPAAGPSWFAADAPRALQTRLFLGFTTRSDRDRDAAPRAVLAEMIEDELRVVREGMGASYGVEVDYADGPAGGALMISTLVDEARAGAVLERVRGALAGLRADAAAQRPAFVRARKKALATAIARRGGASAVARQLGALAIAGHPPAHADTVAHQIAALTPADVARVAAADLDEGRMAVLVRGRKASVDAAYAHIQVTPERPVPAKAEPAPVFEPKADAPPPKPAPVATGPTRDRDDQLLIGSPHAIVGPRRKGLFLNDRQLTLDEFLRIGGADDLRRSMRTRTWVRRGFIGAGLVAMVAGAVIGVRTGRCEPDPQTPADEVELCEAEKSAAQNRGLVAFGLGVALAVTGSQIPRVQPTPADLRRIADDFNRRPVATPPRRAPPVAITPVAVPGGGGLVVSGAF